MVALWRGGPEGSSRRECGVGLSMTLSVVLLSGGSGQLGREARSLFAAVTPASDSVRFLAPTRSELDLADLGSIVPFLDGTKPQLVLHVGA